MKPQYISRDTPEGIRLIVQGVKAGQPKGPTDKDDAHWAEDMAQRFRNLFRAIYG